MWKIISITLILLLVLDNVKSVKDYSDRIVTPFVHVWSKKILPTLTPDQMSDSVKLIKTKGISRVGHQKYSNGDVKMRKMTKGVKQKPATCSTA